MTIASEINRNEHTQEGTQDTFEYEFLIWDASQIKVYVDGALKALNDDYTVTNVGISAGGNVVFATGHIPNLGASIVIVRSLNYTQTMDLAEGGVFSAETMEASFDKAVVLSQQLKETFGRVPQLLPYSLYKDLTLPDPSAGTVLVWNSLLTGLVNSAFSLSGDLGTYCDFGAAPPTTGTWPLAWVRWNSAPEVGGIAGWICTVAGTPGTWIVFPFGPWIDSRSYTTLELADAAAAAAGKLLVIAQNHTLTANTVLASSIMIIPGGSFTQPASWTLTINGTFSNPSNGQCFIGFANGDVTFAKGSVKELYAEWWATNTTPGTTDMATAVQCMLTAGTTAKIRMRSLGQTYAIGTGLTVTNKYDWTWEGEQGLLGEATSLKWIGAANGTIGIFAGCRSIEINNIRLDGNSLAGVGFQFRNGTPPVSWPASNLISKNLFTRYFTGTPGVGLLLGEGDATPGIEGIHLYNFHSNDNVEGIRIDNGGGQDIQLFGGTIHATSYGIHFKYGGIVTVHGLQIFGDVTCFYMPSGYRLNLYNSYTEGISLIHWGNHPGSGILMMGIDFIQTSAGEPIIYEGGALNIVSINNKFDVGITLAVAGSQTVNLTSLNDLFITGGWINENLSGRNNFIVSGGALTFGYSATAVWNPGSLADGEGTYTDVTVIGAALGDYVVVSAPYDLQGIIATAYVSAANNVVVRLQNETGGVIDLASGTWKVRVLK